MYNNVLVYACNVYIILSVVTRISIRSLCVHYSAALYMCTLQYSMLILIVQEAKSNPAIVKINVMQLSIHNNY